MHRKAPPKIFSLETEFPEIDFNTIDPGRAGEEFHTSIASRFAWAWAFRDTPGEPPTPTDNVHPESGGEEWVEKSIRALESGVVGVLKDVGYPVDLDTPILDVKKMINRKLSLYMVRVKQCDLHKTPKKGIEILLLSYITLFTIEMLHKCWKHKNIDGAITYSFNAINTLNRLLENYRNSVIGKIGGDKKREISAPKHTQIIENDRELRRRRPTMKERSRAIEIGRKLDIPAETVRRHLKKER